jgi:5-methylcytosine-specific restriction endonuclease McrA
MQVAFVDQAIELLEKANADLEPELLSARDARRLLKDYARAEKLAAFGVAALARKVNDASELAQVTGSSMGKAKATVTTGKVLDSSPELSDAMRFGDVSLDQAAEIAKAEESRPGAAKKLLRVAQRDAFHVLKDQARKVKLEAEQHNNLSGRQHSSRSAHSYSDELGMVHIHVALEPHIGTPIVARAEAEAARLARAAKGKEAREPFECYLADAYSKLLSRTATTKGRARRPELVVLVSHRVAKRGWKDVKAGEVCKIPGIGPVSPQVAKEIAADAFLSGVFYDGKDLRHLKRWSRSIPVEVAIALELGLAPSFDGVACVDCGNRFRTEFDHVEPRAAHGPSSNGNLRARCWTCHQAKTERDRRNGKLKARDP